MRHGFSDDDYRAARRRPLLQFTPSCELASEPAIPRVFGLPPRRALRETKRVWPPPRAPRPHWWLSFATSW